MPSLFLSFRKVLKGTQSDAAPAPTAHPLDFVFAAHAVRVTESAADQWSGPTQTQAVPSRYSPIGQDVRTDSMQAPPPSSV